MVNVSEFVPKPSIDFVTVELVKELKEKKGVIMPQASIVEFDFVDKHTGETTHVRKPQIHVSINKTIYKWTMSATTNEMLMKELGPETDNWTGAVVKFFINKAGNTEYVAATVIALPEGLKELSGEEEKEENGGSPSSSTQGDSL